jgi:hypothetical protein
MGHQIICRNCGTSHDTGKFKRGIYCSIKCQQDYIFKEKFNLWMKGENAFGKNTSIRRALIHRDGDKCATCGIYEWNGKPITFEVEHIDGNPENDHQSNLELICPNCHSQTNTYKGKNKGNGRHTRRKRYAEGKSY